MAKSIIIKELIRELGLNISSFEREIGASPGTVAKAIDRNSKISDAIIWKISKKYPNINEQWLIDGHGPIFITVNGHHLSVKNTPAIKSDNVLTSNATYRLLDDNYQINKETFADLLPSPNNKNNWLPYYNSIETLISQEKEIPYNNKTPYGWPMNADNLVRSPFDNGDFMIMAPPFDNMAPRILPREPIVIKKVNKNEVLPGIPYLIVFDRKDRTEGMIYYISNSNKEGSWKLFSENKEYGWTEVSIDTVLYVFKVNPRM